MRRSEYLYGDDPSRSWGLINWNCLNVNNLYDSKPNIYGDKLALYKISEHRYDIDINSEKDLSIAEAIFDKLEFN